MDYDFTENINREEYFNIISETADENNVEVFIIGGFVRDLVLKRKRTEIDLLVVGNGPDFAEKVAKELGVGQVSIFKNFGTAHFKYNDIDFEFVGARKESYKHNSRNPEVEVGTFEDDISRRDFTINTLALSLNRNNFGEIIDMYNAVDDLKNRIIKTPLDPKATFNDDPLRIMRAFRFASQLCFNVSDEVKKASEEMANRLEIVSQERITDEFLKILASDTPSIGLKLLYECKVMGVVFPEIANLEGVEQRKDFHHKDVFYHTCQVVDNIARVSDEVWLRFAGLVHDIAKPLTKKFNEDVGWTFHGHEEVGARMMKRIFKRLKLPFNKLEYVEKLIRLHLRPIALVDEEVTDSAIRRLIVAADEDLEALITLCRADITSKNPEKVKKYLNNYEIIMQKVRDVREKDELRAFQSPVRGEEIMRVFNIPPSKKVGEIKTAIEEAILDGIIPNDYNAAYEYMMKIKDRFII